MTDTQRWPKVRAWLSVQQRSRQIETGKVFRDATGDNLREMRTRRNAAHDEFQDTGGRKLGKLANPRAKKGFLGHAVREAAT